MRYSFLRRASANSVVLRVIHSLRLGGLLKKVYYSALRPSGKIMKLSFHGVSMDFFVHDFEELLVAASILEEGDRDERRMLAVLMDDLHPGDSAFDIGANVGVHSVFLAKKVGPNGRVIAIEPESMNFSRLKKNIDLNKLGNIIPIRAALGDRKDIGGLYIKKRIGRGAISLIRDEGSEYCQEVPILTGDDLVTNHGLPIPSALKIDVEGYEYLVLLGIKRILSHQGCQLVCCEIHSQIIPEGTGKRTIDEYMKSLDFINTDTFKRGSEIHAVYRKERAKPF